MTVEEYFRLVRTLTQERVDEIEAIAGRHGIYLAPFYNADGPVAAELVPPLEIAGRNGVGPMVAPVGYAPLVSRTG